MKGETVKVQRKAFGPIEFKADQPGAFRAILARFDTGPDKEGDVYLGPEAWPVGKSIVISAYMHTSWGGVLPVGKGTVGADAKSAWVDGEFFLNTTGGKDTYNVVKALAESGQGEWSYGYDAVDFSTEAKDLEPYGTGAKRLLKELDVFEGSPVLVGAGNGTGTESIKARRISAAAKATITVVDPEMLALIGQVDALSDDLDDAIDALMASAGIPDPDELAEALEESVTGAGAGNADNNPQTAAASMPKGLTLAAQTQEAPAAVLSLVSRYKALAALRAKEGRVLSAANRDRLTALLDALNSAGTDIQGLLDATNPDDGKADDEAVNKYIEFEAQRTALIAAGLI